MIFLYLQLIDVIFRVLHVVFHRLSSIQDGDVVHQEVTMFVYTEDSILVLVSYQLQELLGPQNNVIIFRYFADLYYAV